MEVAPAFAIRNAVSTALFRCNISLVGDAGVGKTSIARQFGKNTFSEERNCTVGLDITTRHSQSSDGQKIVYHIHDTAGQEKFKSMLPAFIRNCDAIAVVYDVGCRTSFENVSKWLYFVNNYLPVEAPTILVGNKVDLDHCREVSYEEGRQTADRSNLLFLETSAKTGEKVTDVFQQLSTVLRDRRISDIFHGQKAPLSSQGIILSEHIDMKKGCCS